MRHVPPSAQRSGARLMQDWTVNALSRSLPMRRRSVDAAAGEPQLDNVAAELILLREENASLKAERNRGPNVAALVERVRGLAASAVGEDESDNAWDVLTAAMVMREVLMDVCLDIERCMLALQGRLRPLDPETLVSGMAHGAGNGNGNVNVNENGNANGNGNGNGHVPLHDTAARSHDVNLLHTLALAEGVHHNREGD